MPTVPLYIGTGLYRFLDTFLPVYTEIIPHFSVADPVRFDTDPELSFRCGSGSDFSFWRGFGSDFFVSMQIRVQFVICSGIEFDFPFAANPIRLFI
jgi:hypothetical protein